MNTHTGPSRKGMYLTVMAACAFLFVIALFVAPSFMESDHPVPPLMFVLILIVLAAIAMLMFIWRQGLKRRGLSRDEGVVSGQNEHPFKP
jgi:threonine/homoserine/homoserine lactone efflux protein